MGRCYFAHITRLFSITSETRIFSVREVKIQGVHISKVVAADHLSLKKASFQQTL